MKNTFLSQDHLSCQLSTFLSVWNLLWLPVKQHNPKKRCLIQIPAFFCFTTSGCLLFLEFISWDANKLVNSYLIAGEDDCITKPIATFCRTKPRKPCKNF